MIHPIYRMGKLPPAQSRITDLQATFIRLEARVDDLALLLNRVAAEVDYLGRHIHALEVEHERHERSGH